MPAAYAAPPATTAKALDSIANEVLAMATASPRPTHPQLAAAIQKRFAVEVEPDNLRMWLARRHADAVRASVTPAVRSPFDDHLELVNELRDPVRNGGSVYQWVQVLAALKRLDPNLAAYTPEALRSWYSRRVTRGRKAQEAAEAAEAERRAREATDRAAKEAAALAAAGRSATAPAATPDTNPSVESPPTRDAGAGQAYVPPRTTAQEAAPAGTQAADAATELELLRGNASNPLGDLLGQFFPGGAP